MHLYKEPTQVRSLANVRLGKLGPARLLFEDCGSPGPRNDGAKQMSDTSQQRYGDATNLLFGKLQAFDVNHILRLLEVVLAAIGAKPASFFLLQISFLGPAETSLGALVAIASMQAKPKRPAWS